MSDIFDGVYNAGRNVGYTHEVAESLAEKAVKTNRHMLLSQVSKNLRTLVVMKGGKPVGATSERKDGTYKKISIGVWEKVQAKTVTTKSPSFSDEKNIKTLTPIESTDKIKAYLDSVGIQYDHSGSNLSDSNYINFEDKEGNTKKLRISDHNLPQKYGTKHGTSGADYEIGKHEDSQSNDWRDAAVYVHEQSGKQMPKELQAYKDRRDLEKEKYKTEQEQKEREKKDSVKSIRDTASKIKEVVSNDKTIKDYFNELDSLTGPKNREKRIEIKGKMAEALTKHGIDKKESDELFSNVFVFDEMRKRIKDQ